MEPLNIETARPMQTVQTQIRRHRMSDKGIHCLPLLQQHKDISRIVPVSGQALCGVRRSNNVRVWFVRLHGQLIHRRTEHTVFAYCKSMHLRRAFRNNLTLCKNLW